MNKGFEIYVIERGVKNTIQNAHSATWYGYTTLKEAVEKIEWAVDTYNDREAPFTRKYEFGGIAVFRNGKRCDYLTREEYF